MIGKHWPALPRSRSPRHRQSVIRLDDRQAGPGLHRRGAHRVPSVFTVLRAITALFHSEEDANLGLYGAFGYDLAFQFDPVDYKLKRSESQRDIVLFLPDEILVVDHYSAKAWIDRYDMPGTGSRPKARPRDAAAEPFQTADRIPPRGDHRSRRICRAGDARRRKASSAATCSRSCPARSSTSAARPQPSEISRKLKAINPSPYSFFINLGEERISDRRLARNVRARLRPPHRDLPDFRHDQARRRCDCRLASRS